MPGERRALGTRVGTTRHAVAACVLSLGAVSTPEVAHAEPSLSPSNADYTIAVELDEAAKTLRGEQTLRWTNIQDSPTRELWFHLYWNGWRNKQSTWMREDAIRGRADHRGEDGGWASIDITRARLAEGDVDLMPSARYESPDDDNPYDRTVWVVDLPEEVAPGETVEVALSFESKIPRTFARTGYRGDFFFFAHWFPKLGVFEPDGWNCHQYHAATEFYSDYGEYDVTMRLPSRFVVGASGREIERVEHDDGTVSHRYRQDDIHGFAWTASPDYVESWHRFDVEGLPGVDVRLLMQPEHLHQRDRHVLATSSALEWYGKWFGAYPYPQVTVIDPAWGSGAGGMEYPTLYTCGTQIFNPFGAGSPEGVTIHEAGHQFWYGVVGNNEFEHAWIDEGINSFADARTYDVVYGPTVHRKRYFQPPGVKGRGFFSVLFDEVSYDRDLFGNRWHVYRRFPDADVPATPTYRYHPKTAGIVSYTKTAVWLATLENHLGWERLQRGLALFYERHRFSHPTGEDLIAALEEAADEDLSWFFDQVHYGSATFDYAIDRVASSRLDVEGTDDGVAKTKSFRNEVIVRRRGDGHFPVDVVLVYEDGSESRHRWDGRALHHTIVEEGDAKLLYAEVDPERVLLLDKSFLNNSLFSSPQSRMVSVKWSAKWMMWLQDHLYTWSFFI